MSVGSGIPFNAYTGNGLTTVFAYGFTLLDADDLVVTINGVVTSSYTVAGLGVATGGSITFGAAPANGAAVLLQRVIQLVREADYQTNGDLQADTVNGDFDRLWLAVQQVNAQNSRALRVPEVAGAVELPVSAARANLLLGFDSNGSPIAVAPVAGTAAALAIDLASTAAGKGASLIGVEDVGGHLAGTNVEAALQQLAPGVFQTPWYITKDSPVLMSLRHATSGNIVQQWQDGGSGTATYFYRGLSIQTDSHSVQMGPATNGGSCDLLWQRSTLNADPAGNRFNFTFEESTDRLLLSFATTASGAPAFDSAMQLFGGTSPQMLFPAIAAQFNIGVGVKQRAAGGFECRFVPTSSTVADIKQIGGSGTTFLSFADAALGFFGTAPVAKPTVTGSRAGNAALASLLTALANLGLITNSSTA